MQVAGATALLLLAGFDAVWAGCFRQHSFDSAVATSSSPNAPGALQLSTQAHELSAGSSDGNDETMRRLPTPQAQRRMSEPEPWVLHAVAVIALGLGFWGAVKAMEYPLLVAIRNEVSRRGALLCICRAVGVWCGGCVVLGVLCRLFYYASLFFPCGGVTCTLLLLSLVIFMGASYRESRYRAYRCVVDAIIRRGLDIDSENEDRVGILPRGATVYALERATNLGGQERVRIHQGWVSVVSTDGTQLLVPISVRPLTVCCLRLLKIFACFLATTGIAVLIAPQPGRRSSAECRLYVPSVQFRITCVSYGSLFLGLAIVGWRRKSWQRRLRTVTWTILAIVVGYFFARLVVYEYTRDIVFSVAIWAVVSLLPAVGLFPTSCTASGVALEPAWWEPEILPQASTSTNDELCGVVAVGTSPLASGTVIGVIAPNHAGMSLGQPQASVDENGAELQTVVSVDIDYEPLTVVTAVQMVEVLQAEIVV